MIPSPSFNDTIAITLNKDEIAADTEGLYSDTGVVGWFYSFVKMCKETLNLTIQKGPGTSLGIIQDKVGFLPYQFDTDWNNNILYPGCPQPISPWPEEENWSESNDTYINTYGIDFKNYRFDTIIWFSRFGDSNPIGIRFKYPVITGRDVMTPFWYYTMPVFLPWQDGKLEKLNEKTKLVSLSELNKISSSQWADYWGSESSSSDAYSPINYRTEGYQPSEGEVTGYYSLGNHFCVLNNQELTFSENYYTQSRYWDKTFNQKEVGLSISSDIVIKIDTNLKQDIVVFRMSKNGENILSFIYGNFENDPKDSYCIVNAINRTEDILCDFIASYGKFWDKPQKFVKRIVSSQEGVDTRISRVVLPNSDTMIPTESLFQVFSFGTPMVKEESYLKIFLENNNNSRFFKLINFGNITDNNYENSTLIAIEKAVG